jgi:hypothetical protein
MSKTFENEFILMGKYKETCQSMLVTWPTGNEHCLPVSIRSPTNITVKATEEADTLWFKTQHRPEQQTKQNFTSVAGLPSSLDAIEFINGISMF